MWTDPTAGRKTRARIARELRRAKRRAREMEKRRRENKRKCPACQTMAPFRHGMVYCPNCGGVRKPKGEHDG